MIVHVSSEVYKNYLCIYLVTDCGEIHVCDIYMNVWKTEKEAEELAKSVNRFGLGTIFFDENLHKYDVDLLILGIKIKDALCKEPSARITNMTGKSKRQFEADTREEHDRRIVESADYFTTTRFMGKGKFITRQYSSLELAHASITADMRDGRTMIYAVRGDISVWVENV